MVLSGCLFACFFASFLLFFPVRPAEAKGTAAEGAVSGAPGQSDEVLPGRPSKAAPTARATTAAAFPDMEDEVRSGIRSIVILVGLAVGVSGGFWLLMRKRNKDTARKED